MSARPRHPSLRSSARGAASKSNTKITRTKPRSANKSKGVALFPERRLSSFIPFVPFPLHNFPSLLHHFHTMRRHALIFLVSIFLPSLVLGWLALRAAGKQRILIERQAADLHQAETDVLASELRDAIEAKQRAFAEYVRALVAKDGAAALAENYRPMLATVWPDGGIPFAISPRGTLAYPSPAQVRGARQVEAFLAKTTAHFWLTPARRKFTSPSRRCPPSPIGSARARAVRPPTSRRFQQPGRPPPPQAPLHQMRPKKWFRLKPRVKTNRRQMMPGGQQV